MKLQLFSVQLNGANVESEYLVFGVSRAIPLLLCDWIWTVLPQVIPGRKP